MGNPATGFDRRRALSHPERTADCAARWCRHGNLKKSAFSAYQTSARGGVVKVRLAGERLILGGNAVTVLRGELL